MQQANRDTYWEIKSLAEDLGFADFGCAKAGPVPVSIQNNYLYAMNKGYFASMQYLNKNIEKRFNPCNLVEDAASVLVFLAPFSLPQNLTPPAGISQYALGEDYHTVIKGKLFKIMELLSSRYQNFKGRAFTDSAPVLEREWAVKAGLGFIGKNNFLISKKCGIKNFLATIICNLNLPQTDEMEPEKRWQTTASCGDCNRCLVACPTGALHKEFCIDAGKCISYHTIENRNLKEEILCSKVPHFNNRLFGCDSCLDACPWNSRNLSGWKEFHKNYEFLSNLEEDWWMNVSEMEFNSKFKDSPLSRGGLKNIQTALIWGKKEKNG